MTKLISKFAADKRKYIYKVYRHTKLILTTIALLLGITTAQAHRAETLTGFTTEYGTNNRTVKETILETPKPIETGEGIKGIDSTDGKALLQSILAPLKGKFVLLDVWGTWCGSCRMALKNSTEEHEHLKAFDIVYLYLANSSPKEEWENVIKMYSVNGENVVPYNLPREQQAIEQ